jgi:hypothetical protein
MTIIQFKTEQSYYTEADKQNIANEARLKAEATELHAKNNAFNAAFASGENPAESDRATRIAQYVDGKRVRVPSFKEQQIENLREIRLNDEALDFVAVKVNDGKRVARRKMVQEAKPQIVAAEKKIYDAVQTLFDAFLPYWTAERQLRGNGISPLGLFNSPLGELLGAPMAPHSDWAELFRHGVSQGHISKMPAVLS